MIGSFWNYFSMFMMMVELLLMICWGYVVINISDLETKGGKIGGEGSKK